MRCIGLHGVKADELAPGARAKAAFIWEKFPKFVLGFLAVSAVATAGLMSKGQLANVANVSKWAFLLTFAECRPVHRHPADRPQRMASAGRRGDRAGSRRRGVAGPGAVHLTGAALGRGRLSGGRVPVRRRGAAELQRAGRQGGGEGQRGNDCGTWENLHAPRQ